MYSSEKNKIDIITQVVLHYVWIIFIWIKAVRILKRLSPEQRLQMSDDFFGKLLTSEDFFQRQHFFAEILLHGFEANQVPKK